MWGFNLPNWRDEDNRDAPRGYRSLEGEYGFMCIHEHRILMQATGQIQKRLCRWCGSQMVWHGLPTAQDTKQGVFRCSNSKSCDTHPATVLFLEEKTE